MVPLSFFAVRRRSPPRTSPGCPALQGGPGRGRGGRGPEKVAEARTNPEHGNSSILPIKREGCLSPPPSGRGWGERPNKINISFSFLVRHGFGVGLLRVPFGFGSRSCRVPLGFRLGSAWVPFGFWVGSIRVLGLFPPLRCFPMLSDAFRCFPMRPDALASGRRRAKGAGRGRPEGAAAPPRRGRARARCRRGRAVLRSVASSRRSRGRAGPRGEGLRRWRGRRGRDRRSRSRLIRWKAVEVEAVEIGVDPLEGGRGRGGRCGPRTASRSRTGRGRPEGAAEPPRRGHARIRFPRGRAVHRAVASSRRSQGAPGRVAGSGDEDEDDEAEIEVDPAVGVEVEVDPAVEVEVDPAVEVEAVAADLARRRGRGWAGDARKGQGP